VSKEPVVGYEDSGDMPLRVAALSGLSSTMHHSGVEIMRAAASYLNQDFQDFQD